MKTNSIIFLILLTITLVDCRKEDNAPAPDVLIFPVGRSFLNTTTTDIKVGDKAYTSGFVYDSCGGYWLHISKSEIADANPISITFTRKKKDLEFFPENPINGGKWTKPSYYIDSDNETIKTKAAEITAGLSSNIEKARAIQQYVIGHVSMNVYKDSFLAKASATYSSGYGSCMNFSRLYVALCRAANVPARTIWGIVYGYNNDNIYDYHHQWAEIMDEDGLWHPSDFNYTKYFNLNDVRYLDLIYAAEENVTIKNRHQYEMMLNNLNYYNNYPVTLSAHLGFKLQSDNRPDSMVVVFNYKR